jgi:hypothetical protein
MPHLCREDRRTQAKKRLDASVYDRFRLSLESLPVPTSYKDLQLLTSSYSQLVSACRVAPLFPGEEVKSDKKDKHDKGKRLGDALQVIAQHSDGLNASSGPGNNKARPLPVPQDSASATNGSNVA